MLNFTNNLIAYEENEIFLYSDLYLDKDQFYLISSKKVRFIFNIQINTNFYLTKCDFTTEFKIEYESYFSISAFFSNDLISKTVELVEYRNFFSNLFQKLK